MNRHPVGQGAADKWAPTAGLSTRAASTYSSRVNELVRFALVAFFPREGDLPGLAELGVDDKIVALRRESTTLFWIGIVGAALFFQLTPILTVRRPWPAVFLTPEQLDRHAHGLASHPAYLVRQLVMLIKLTGGLFWGQSDEVRAFLRLPAYPEDPGTRRTEAHPERHVTRARAPADTLVQLGLREEARGRSSKRAHAPEATPPDVREA